jgi:hypothetical protein
MNDPISVRDALIYGAFAGWVAGGIHTMVMMHLIEKWSKRKLR